MKGKNWLVFCVGVICLVFFSSQSIRGQQTNKQKASTNEVSKALERLPVLFRKNQGQWNKAILYNGSSARWNANVNFLQNGISFGFNRPLPRASNTAIEQYEKLVWNIYFKNANPFLTVEPEGMKESHTNYLIGDPSNYKTNVPDCKILHYRNIYPGIDADYYSADQSLKYDFIIQPGSNPATIELTAAGIKKLTLNPAGELEIKTAWGILTEKIPESYQLINGVKKTVSVRYRLLSDTTYGFETQSDYDAEFSLIIDPVTLAWSTYFGNTSGDYSSNFSYLTCIDVDPAGNIYATGFYDGSFPVTAGTYQTLYGGGGSAYNADAYVFKLNPTASAVIYATFMGGQGRDEGYGIRVNSAGEAFVTGYTGSSDWPSTGTLSATNAFAIELNAAGSAAVYQLRLAGNGTDYGTAININSNNEAFIMGCTSSTDFPVTANATQSVNKGSYDIFITHLSNTGAVLFSTYLGGSLKDGDIVGTVGNQGAASGIVADATGNVYITTSSTSLNFPTTAGAYQTAALANEKISAIISKINTNTGTLVYSTYLNDAGTGFTAGTDITVNSSGDIYICGIKGGIGSVSPSWQDFSYPYLYSGVEGYFDDAFAAHLHPAGAGAADLVYYTPFGGSLFDEAFGIGLTPCGEVFVAGRTMSSDFPVTSCAYQSANADSIQGINAGDGLYDEFLVKLDANGNQQYGSYMGGHSYDYWGMKLVVRGGGLQVYLGGTSHSNDFPVTAGTIQPYKGNADGVDQPVVYQFKTSITAAFTNTAPACNTPLTFTDQSTGTCVWQSGTWTPTSWSWSFGDGSTSTLQNPTHTYLTGGTYTVKLVIGCPSDSVTKTITLPNGTLTLTPSSTAINCPTAGSASVVATGGTGTYTYRWQPGGQTGSTASILTPGTYTVYVSDGVACGNSTTVTVKDNGLPLSLTPSAMAPSTCSSSNGQASVTATTGTAPYKYTWSNGGNTQTITNVAAGNYTVTVNDATCYEGTTVVFVPAPVAITVTPAVIQNVCNSNPGEAEALFPSGGTTPYTYSWSNGLVGNNSTAFFDTNLPAGTYTLYVTDANGCIGEGSVTIAQTVMATVTSTAAGCGGGGTATASAVSGGVGPYTYSWNPGSQSTATATDLTAGTYTVYVNDSYDCFFSQTVTVAAGGASITVSTSSTPATCTAANGTATAAPSGGTGAYTYSWSGGGGAASTASNLVADTYTVTVTDHSGCSATTAVTVTSTNTVINITTAEFNTTCGNSNGSASVTSISGGSPAYSYSWSPGGATGQTVTGLAVGGYTVTVKDANGCTQTTAINVAAIPGTFTVSVSSSPANCSGTGGSATATISGTASSPTYSWSSGAGNASSATNLTPGSYTVTVSDAGGCTSSSSVTVTQTGLTFSLDTAQTPAGCSGTGGTATATVTGGVSPTYSWSTAQTSATATNLVPGTYTVTVYDGGCNASSTVVVTQSAVTFTLSTSQTPSNCSGTGGTATVTVTGGISPTYSWSTAQTTQTSTNLSPATYTVTVSDGGCSATSTITVTQSGITFSLDTSSSPANCSGTAGSATVTVTGGVSPAYSWNNTQTTQTATNLAPAIYTVTVTDGGCSATSTVAVTQSTISFTLSGTSQPVNCLGPGSATVTANGATGPLYTWSTSQTTPTATGLTAGIYTVTVTDVHGCAASLTIPVGDSSVISVNAGADTSICRGNQVQLNGSGTGSFSWSPGNTLNDSTIATPIALPLTTTNYILTVKSGPCSGKDTVTVSVIKAPTPAVTSDTIIVAGQTLQLNASGGISYLWTPSYGLNDSLIADPTAGPSKTTTYVVLITDGNGCSSVDSVTVTVLDKSFCGPESIFVPNAFSPNGDGENDLLYVRSLCIYYLDFRIYDRWGEQVFHTGNPEEGWDGTFRGQPMEMAVFMYTLQATTFTGVKISKKGNISLLR